MKTFKFCLKLINSAIVKNLIILIITVLPISFLHQFFFSVCFKFKLYARKNLTLFLKFLNDSIISNVQVYIALKLKYLKRVSKQIAFSNKKKFYKSFFLLSF